MSTPPSGRPLSLWHRMLAAALRGACFGRVAVNGAAPVSQGRPQLIVASHRNGAIDGFQVLRAFPQAQFLVSYQLMRSPLLRLLFTGVPVVRPQDVERYGMHRDQVRDPIRAAADHLRAGGDLVIFPEGTSHWGPGPQSYRQGAARTAAQLLADGVEFDVVPVGLFYTAPDRLRSRAEVHCGPPVRLLAEDDDGGRARDASAWEPRLHTAISTALDDVSVNCPDPGTFAQVHERARARFRAGERFSEACLDEQQQAGAAPREGPDDTPDVDEAPVPADAPGAAPSPAGVRLIRGFGLVLMAAVAPVLLAAWLAGRRADARNTVTFFRMLGGLAASLLWAPVLVVATVLWPLPIGGALLAAVLGWWVIGLRRIRP